jgi:hypothetical protein
MYQFIKGITYTQPGMIKEDVIDLTFFQSIVGNLEKTDGTTKDLAQSSPKYKKLWNDYQQEQDIAAADTIDFDKAYENPNA